MLRTPLEVDDPHTLRRYSSSDEVLLAFDTGVVEAHEPIQVRMPTRECMDPFPRKRMPRRR